MKNNSNKQRLFEVMGKVDKTFKSRLNEFYDDNYIDPIQQAKAKARSSDGYNQQIMDDALEYVGGMDVWNTLNQNEKDQVLRLVEPNMNEDELQTSNNLNPDEVLSSYLETALWAEGGDGNELDSKSTFDIDEQSKQASKNDIIKFIKQATQTASDELANYDAESLGHNFWLSRNGHGAGFFDDNNDKLQNIARSFKQADIYVGDDEKVYISGNEPNMNEILGFSQKEKDKKALKQKIEQAKFELSKNNPAATAFAQPGLNNDFQQQNELMRVRLNMLKRELPTVMELLPKLFDDRQGFVKATMAWDDSRNVISGLVLGNWSFVIDNDGYVRRNNKGVEYLTQKLDSLLQNTNEAYGTPDPLGSNKAKQMNEMPKWGVNKANPKYSHFAVLKDTNKIVNGWEYRDYDQAELRQYKKDYFYQDIVDMQINPKIVNIVTAKHLQKQGIDPYDFKNWHKQDVDGTDIYTM